MRCLNCHKDGILKNDTVCPQCYTYLPILLRDVLPLGMMLHNNTYRIDYPLNRGGFGIVYRAVHTGLDCLVAIKEFYPREYASRRANGWLEVPSKNKNAFDAEYQQFLLEGRILAELNHPGITKVRDLFEERDTAYLVMELLGGQSLRQELEQQPGGKLAPERIHKVIEHLVTTLEFLHRRKIYHLDIKPENVFVTSSGRVVLIDFGAARFGVDGYVRRRFDPDYAAPELLNGGDIGPQSDLYELGVMAYELLTGIRPSSALARVYNDKWDVAGLSEPWRSCLTPALQLAKGKRPESVLSWWLQTMGASLPPLFRKHSDRNDQDLTSDFVHKPTTLLEQEQINLAEQLAKCQPGQQDWRKYEDICIAVLNEAFVPLLRSVEPQARTESGLERRDALLPLLGASEGWEEISRKYDAHFLLCEFKNYVDPIHKDEVNQAANYLKSHVGRLGIIFSRKPPSSSALNMRRSIYADSRKLILFFEDKDLIELLKLKEARQNPLRHIEAAILDFLLKYD